VQLVNRKLHAEVRKVLSRSGKTKNIGLRVTPEKYAAVEARAKQLDLNIQQAVEHALDGLLADAGVVIPVAAKPPRRGSLAELISEKLQVLEDGQGAILQVLQRIAEHTPDQKPIESVALKAHDQTERGDSGLVATPAHIATGLIEHGPGSKPLEAIKKDRRGKQTKTPGSSPKRRDRGAG